MQVAEVFVATKSIDLNKIKTVSLNTRPSKVNNRDFARTLKKPLSFRSFFDSIPGILCGRDLKELVSKIKYANSRKKPVICSFGAHVIKCGLSPMLIDLAQKGVITAFASNGASMIHDFELAYSGFTSEDVGARLKDGSFGMTRETGEFINEAAKKAYNEKLGLGFVLGREIEKSRLKYRKLSIYAAAYRLAIPATVPVAIGTDIIY